MGYGLSPFEADRPRYAVLDHNGDTLYESDVWAHAAKYAREWGGAYVYDMESDEKTWVEG